MVQHLFVYGTLMRAMKHPMHAQLARHAEFDGEAFMHGRLYDLGRYPGAVASSSAADKVIGELYRLSDPDALFLALDAYEHCGPDDPQPTKYVRRKEMVYRANGEPVKAWIYLYNRPVNNLSRIECGRYLKS
jgi:gamma-glutamylcyclotransferase (GGCT)/AIG2-like uncharacterized protein YtfP